MEFTKEEKEVLKYVIKQHLEEVKKNEQMLNQPPILLAAEVRYDEFLSNLLKKL